MKVTFVGHASILIETQGLRILSDPWWGHPCFGAQWWNYPRAVGHLAEGSRVDYIYISHGHHDHLHPGTLKKLDRGAKVLVATGSDMRESITKAGFEVVEISADREYDLGSGVKCRIMPTHAHDSLMALSDRHEVCVNLNDALHSAPADVQKRFVATLRELYPSIDYVFCGYGVASHFPNCYRIPGKNREATAMARQRHFNEQWAGLIAGLSPRSGLPFAADVVLLEDDLFWVNEPTHNTERPLSALARLHPEFSGQTFDIAPGFTIENGIVLEKCLRQPIRAASIRGELNEDISRANRFGSADRDTVVSIGRMVSENIEKCREYLLGYRGGYRILVRVRGSDMGIFIEKRASTIESQVVESSSCSNWDVMFTTRAQYLRTSLTRKYGNETIFVGSGGVFDYPSRKQAERNLQDELSVMLSWHEQPPAARAVPALPWATTAKRMVKRAIGRTELDLYDLNSWTVWEPY